MQSLYWTLFNTHNRQIPMSPVGFKYTVTASELLQTHALDRAATRFGYL